MGVWYTEGFRESGQVYSKLEVTQRQIASNSPSWLFDIISPLPQKKSQEKLSSSDKDNWFYGESDT